MRSVRVVTTAGDDSPKSDAAVVVEAEDGEEFELTIDDALRDAVAARARVSAADAVPLSPRDIQVRVRAGESPEDLAADSGTPIERIMRFAFPVLEERARVGDEARRSRARRDGDGALVPFGETVDRRLVTHGIDPVSVSWDSFRRPDGSWVVIASWHANGTERHAHWAFSLAARTVLPADEVGSDLLSDRPLRPVVRAVPDHDEAAAAREQVYDQNAPAARGFQPGPIRSDTHDGHDSHDSHDTPPLRLAEPLFPRPAATPALPPAPVPSVDEPVSAPVVVETALHEATLHDLFSTATDDEPAQSTHDQPAPGQPAPAPRSGRSKREQTKIPSWDDILLGVRRNND
jgi:hypothetical protein